MCTFKKVQPSYSQPESSFFLTETFTAGAVLLQPTCFYTTAKIM
jgi:hypothetical protein